MCSARVWAEMYMGQQSRLMLAQVGAAIWQQINHLQSVLFAHAPIQTAHVALMCTLQSAHI